MAVSQLPSSEIEFSAFGSGGGKYDWAELLNGEQWIAVKGEDYEVSDARFRLAANLGTPLTIAAGGIGAILGAILFWRALPGIRRHVQEQGLLPPEELVPH